MLQWFDGASFKKLTHVECSTKRDGVLWTYRNFYNIDKTTYH